ncbi:MULTISPECIES: RibD family protein [Prochlorococcus]|uniref:RibD family protein n=1 Tax=Prochlorococcus TaxID=1218 RepID=UPI0005339094|nr:MULTISPECIES: RibD family protein [Prochlorococcus]KGG13269.1 5-amino-6-(5-phosphoribosylamino)uracil reductase [Prochlorococcus sp. MIT 0601]
MLKKNILNTPYIRLVIVISIDGRVCDRNGLSQTIGGIGDRKVLENALAWSDATLMGTGTLKALKNICLIHNLNSLEKRNLEGKDNQPISLVIGKSQNISPEYDYFKQPVKRWLISTEDENKINSKVKNKFTMILKKKFTWSETLSDLQKLGLSKIVLLGGPKLIESFLIEDRINELQLTIAPKILGGDYPWLNYKDSYNESKWLLKETKVLENDELLVRYIRNKK